LTRLRPLGRTLLPFKSHEGRAARLSNPYVESGAPFFVLRFLQRVGMYVTPITEEMVRIALQE
jgi:hypothetical protein